MIKIFAYIFYIYICPLFKKFFSHVDHSRVLSRVFCVPLLAFDQDGPLSWMGPLAMKEGRHSEHLGGPSFRHTGNEPQIQKETAFGRVTLNGVPDGQCTAVMKLTEIILWFPCLSPAWE